MSSRIGLSAPVSLIPKYIAICLPLRLKVKAPSPSTKPVTYQGSSGCVPRENVSAGNMPSSSTQTPLVVKLFPRRTFSRGTSPIVNRPLLQVDEDQQGD